MARRVMGRPGGGGEDEANATAGESVGAARRPHRRNVYICPRRQKSVVGNCAVSRWSGSSGGVKGEKKGQSASTHPIPSKVIPSS